MRTIKQWIATAALLLVMLPATAEAAPDEGEFGKAASSAQADLAEAQRELAELRDRIADQKLPMTRELSRLENRLSELRSELERVNRQFDTTNLDLTHLRTQMKSREDEIAYLSSLLGEYVRNFESRVHITELQRYREQIRETTLVAEDPDNGPGEVYAAQATLIETSLDRLLDVAGGTRFAGQAVDAAGRMQEVNFALVGPIALYATTDGVGAGLAELRLGSLEPNMVPFDQPELTALARGVVQLGNGRMPIDPTLGNAARVDATKETLVEHVKKGGPVMVPILGLAFASIIVALLKWFQLARVPAPSQRKVEALLSALRSRDVIGARKRVAEVRGPTGEMLREGIEHLGEPKELVEEVMFERMLETRLKLQAYLPFIAMTASAAPLLGLLGTVTGMINTFKLITVFGTGDAQTLSSGISEALITTEFGLIVAIPSLLLYAYLSRRAKRLIDHMEKTAVSFLNRIPSSGVEQRDTPMAASGGEGGGRIVPSTPALAGATADH